MSAAVKQKTKTFSAKYNDDEKDGYNKLESRIKTENDGIPFKNTGPKATSIFIFACLRSVRLYIRRSFQKAEFNKYAKYRVRISIPRRSSAAATLVICGTSRPSEKSSSDLETTCAGVPENAIWTVWT